jgi:hypothetical protein
MLGQGPKSALPMKAIRNIDANDLDRLFRQITARAAGYALDQSLPVTGLDEHGVLVVQTTQRRTASADVVITTKPSNPKRDLKGTPRTR